MTLKVAFMQLGSCWGCHMSLLNSHLTFPMVLPELEVVYWPAVVDFKTSDLEARENGSVDVGFIEGHIRSHHDAEMAKLMREKCKIIVAYGTCAVYGSIAGMANLFTLEELVSRKFEDGGFNEEGTKMPTDAPEIVKHIPLLSDVIKVDINLVGCPPVPGNIIGLISAVIGKPDTKVDKTKSVCEVCSLKKCLLEENKICFGPITAVGEDLSMLAKGYPILGDYGLTDKIDAKRAEKLLEKLRAQPLSQKEVNETVEALLLLLSGAVPLSYLDLGLDPIRQTKLRPDSYESKQIKHPSNPEKMMDILKYPMEGYPEIVSNIIGAALAELKDNANYQPRAKTVCSSCPNNVEDKRVPKYKRDYEGFSDPNKCLLVQGYVCMGPITKAGCGTLCPRANSPCLGCYGPSDDVTDFGARAAGLFPAICDDTPENVEKFFKDPSGLFYRFTTVAGRLNHKLHEPEVGGDKK